MQMKMVRHRTTSVKRDVTAMNPEKKPTRIPRVAIKTSRCVFGGGSTDGWDFTCPQDREEEEPEETDDRCSQGLIDSSQMHLPVEARGKVRKVQVVFVHQVL